MGQLQFALLQSTLTELSHHRYGKGESICSNSVAFFPRLLMSSQFIPSTPVMGKPSTTEDSRLLLVVFFTLPKYPEICHIPTMIPTMDHSLWYYEPYYRSLSKQKITDQGYSHLDLYSSQQDNEIHDIHAYIKIKIS